MASPPNDPFNPGPSSPGFPHGSAPAEQDEGEGDASLQRRGRRRRLSSAPPATGPTGTLALDRPRPAPPPPTPGVAHSLPPMGPLPIQAGASRPETSSNAAPRRVFTLRHWLLLAGGVLLLGLTALAGAVYFTLEHFAKDLPSVEKLKAGYDPPQITRIVARDDTLLASVFTQRRTVVAFDQIPDAAKLAFLAAEDAAFYEHEGLNYVGMLRALWKNIRAGQSVQGGSSITQQVVKNVLLDAERTYKRKVRESILALRLEQSLTKDEIFWLYLNHIYLGHGRYGVEEAARFYFGKHARELSLDEAAILAGLVAAPERYSPRRDAEKSMLRRSYVLDQMLRKGFVTPELHADVKARPLHLSPSEESESRLAPEIVDRVKAELKQALGESTSSGGYTVHTTIDPQLQAAARRAVRDNLDAYMQRHKLLPPFNSPKQPSWAPVFVGQPKIHRIYTGVVSALDDRAGSIDVKVGDVVGRVTLASEARYNPGQLPPSQFTQVGAALRVSLLEAPLPDARPSLRLELGPQSVLVALDVRTRGVVALVGSYEAVTGGLDRATSAKRQPGSAIKPLIYSYALSTKRFTPATMVPTHKLLTGGVEREGKPWASVRQALAQSDNNASVYLLLQSGPSDVIRWSQQFGIESEMQPDRSLALGAYELIPMELANAYAVFASGGNFAVPRYISRIEAPDGSSVPLPNNAGEQRLISPEVAYLTTSLMRSVVTGGTAQAAGRVGRDVAGKTGTTNDNKDAWFVGYSTDLVALVWVGYDDALPLGKNESGSKTALPAWVAFMTEAHKGSPKTAFARPGSLLSVQVDPQSGLLPRLGQTDTQSEDFLPGSEPSSIAPEPLPPDAGAPLAGSAAPGDPEPAAAGEQAASAAPLTGQPLPAPPVLGTANPSLPQAPAPPVAPSPPAPRASAKRLPSGAPP